LPDSLPNYRPISCCRQSQAIVQQYLVSSSAESLVCSMCGML
jgi:uncharacterized ferredoxin-like protein